MYSMHISSDLHYITPWSIDIEPTPPPQSSMINTCNTSSVSFFLYLSLQAGVKKNNSLFADAGCLCLCLCLYMYMYICFLLLQSGENLNIPEGNTSQYKSLALHDGWCGLGHTAEISLSCSFLTTYIVTRISLGIARCQSLFE